VTATIDDMAPVSGRGISTLFTDCVTWPRPAGRRLPIVVLLGPTGSGKTVLLRTLRNQVARAPHAFIDLETRHATGPIDIMTELADQLRGVRFPRFRLGLLATRPTPEGLSSEARRRHLLRRLHRFPVGPTRRWWAGRGRHTATDALLYLNFAFDLDRRDVERELCAALLADLRAAYANPILGLVRTASCVAMIDNAHVGGGAAFVELVAKVRGSEPDPLLVVAASGRALPVRPPGAPDLAAWTRSHDEARWRTRCLPVRLRDLELDDVDRLARVGGLRSRGALASFAHRLTGGHPRGVRTVLDLVEHGKDTVLARSGELLDELLDEVPAELRTALVTCAAAHHLTVPAARAALGGAPVATNLVGTVGDLLWLRGTELHPWPRRLSLLALARRPDDHEDSWAAVHGRLRDHCHATGDRPGELYHRLALGDVEHVVRTLDAELRPGCDPTAWQDTLLTVTSAPSRPAVDEPGGRVRELAGWAHNESRRVRALTWLVAARWVTADPLGDPFCRLEPEIANRWGVLSGAVPHASDVFFEAGQQVLADFDRKGGLVENLPAWRGVASTPETGRLEPPVSPRRKALRV